jgi:hypothetical protein
MKRDIYGTLGANGEASVKKWIVLACVLACLLCTAATFAHHGDAGYDTTQVFTLKATVKDFQFINPHVEIALEAKNEDGTVESWQAEMNGPSILSRASGWNKNTLKPGDRVVLEGHRAKHGLKVIRIEKVSLPDGTELFPKGGNGVTRF